MNISSYIKVFFAALVIGAAYVYGVHYDYLRFIPGLYCEGLGCIGRGIYALVIAVIIVFLFGVYGFFVGKQRRLYSALGCFFIAAVVMGGGICALMQLQKEEIDRNNAAYEAACNQNPVLCPDRAP